MPKVLNIAVVGAGTMAQAIHLPMLRRRWDRFTVTALVDLSPRRRREAAEVFGIAEDKRLTDVAELIAAVRAQKIEVDAVLLSTDGLHVEDVLQIIRRGIPVLVEPPLGFSEEEVRKVADFERMTGRRLVMMAYPQVYDEGLEQIAETVKRRDVRMLDYEILMPASQPMFGHAHVTSSAYDLDSDLRSERRTALQDAVEAGSGIGATQRDRDLYVKGLLTGVAHQLAVVEQIYGPLEQMESVRHWPRGVIPGSIEILARLEGDAPVRLVWHYLPFAPEYVERIDVLSARRRLHLEIPMPSELEGRSVFSSREKQHGKVTEIQERSTTGGVEAMWEAFHELVVSGTVPRTTVSSALAEVALLRQVLAEIVEADGRSIDVDPDAEDEDAEDRDDTDDTADDAADDAAATDAEADAEADADAAGDSDDIADAADEATRGEVAGSSDEATDAPEPEDSAEPSADDAAPTDTGATEESEDADPQGRRFGAVATEVGSAEVIAPVAAADDAIAPESTRSIAGEQDEDPESAPVDPVAASDPADREGVVRGVDEVIDPVQTVDTQDVWGVPEEDSARDRTD